MTTGIQFNLHGDVPVYRQIVAQLSLMIESGDLRSGQPLPSARLLADNLHINRNTVARAYAELSKLGLVEGRGRSGTIVIGPTLEHEGAAAREEARAIMQAATRKCIELGLSAAEIQTLALSLITRAEDEVLKISFVECNADRAKYFATEIEGHLGLRVKALVLGHFDASEERADLILTTFFHLAEVRRLLRGDHTEVVAIVVAPHVQTLVEIASVSKRRKVGIWYSTEDQAMSIRDSLTQSGIENIVVLEHVDDDSLSQLDLVVVPSEMPKLKERLEGRVRVIEFGNVLDAASIRMISDVVADLQRTKSRATLGIE